MRLVLKRYTVPHTRQPPRRGTVSCTAYRFFHRTAVPLDTLS